MSPKIGRNSACICGSGNKYKKCCLSLNEAARWQPPNYSTGLSLGQPRIGERVGDRTLVKVGEAVFEGAWKLFPDFLVRYLPHVLGEQWWLKERERPLIERHPILQWRENARRYAKSLVPNREGTVHARPSGRMAALIELSYDLYTINRSHHLQARILDRLRSVETFYAARFEILVTAALIREGFAIEYEDESDTSRKHPELVATHSVTGERIAVEAKSKGRPGMYGNSGTRPAEVEVSARPFWSIQHALKKNLALPYVVFVDLNVPSADVPIDEQAWKPTVDKVIQELEAKDELPITAAVFTNIPWEYGPELSPQRLRSAYCHAFRNSSHPFSYPDTLQHLGDAILTSADIPSMFS